jgi:hypothetical protein
MALGSVGETGMVVRGGDRSGNLIVRVTNEDIEPPFSAGPLVCFVHVYAFRTFQK